MAALIDSQNVSELHVSDYFIMSGENRTKTPEIPYSLTKVLMSKNEATFIHS